MHISLVLFSLLILTLLGCSSQATPSPGLDRIRRQVKLQIPIPMRLTPGDRKKSALFPKMDTKFIVTEKSVMKVTTSALKNIRTNSLLPKLSLKQKITGDRNVKRMTQGVQGIEPRPVVIRPGNLVKLTSGNGSNTAKPSRAPSVTKKPLMKPMAQLVEGNRKVGAASSPRSG